MKSKTELSALSLEELNAELIALRRKEFNLRLQRATGDVKSSHVFKQNRISIARIKTFQTMKLKESN